MRGINKVILIGTLGKNPESRYTQDGKEVVSISVATSESWKDKHTGQKEERTEWHRVVLFNKLAEISRTYLSQGAKVYIEGSLRTKQWEKEGQKHYTTEIIGSELQMLGGKPESASNEPQSSLVGSEETTHFDDDIPF